MQITIKKQDYDRIVAYAKEQLPDEACGLIAGTEEKEDGVVTARTIEKVYLLTNTDHSNEHFSMDPKEQLHAVTDMRKSGLKPLGNWHSHPETPSRPSVEDIRLSFDIHATYMILSLMDSDKPVLNAFHTDKEKGVYTKENLTVLS
ncbi:MAG: M67 family metallopeptidase [Eubacterium sp.]|nr:M67 family metallopeptidase [Eubacterium sp.]